MKPLLARSVLPLLFLWGCVSGSSGDEQAFCRSVREKVPSLLEAGGFEKLLRGPRPSLDEMTGLVPEALVDDVAVLAKSDDLGELRRAFAAVEGYATSVCPVREE